VSQQTTVAISQDFLEAFANIPKEKQRKVMDFVTKFRYDPRASGINYEKIQKARNPRYRSVRINGDYRGIVLAPEQGEVYVLLWVDKHDAAYQWAERHECQIHPETGTLQIFETLNDGTNEQEASVPAVEKPEPLFALKDREYRRLGVPDEMLARVKAVYSEEALEDLESSLPSEAFEGLYLLAAGATYEEVIRDVVLAAEEEVDTGDFAAALQRDQSKRTFHVVEDDYELQEMLEAPLEKWRVFLHPSQRQLVERHWNGPVRVLGGAGTGKTVVAMHRARWLARNVASEPRQRILFTTFTRNLAVDIRENLRKICSGEELEQIEVTNIDQWVGQFLKRRDYPHQIVYEGQQAYDECWETALQMTPAELSFSDSFYREEWKDIILPQQVLDKAGYFKATRTGRGVPLTRKQRALIWPVFEEMRIQLHQRGRRTIEDATLDAMDLLAREDTLPPYRSLVVDEAQDMGLEVMNLFRHLVPEEKDDLFIVGDAHQRIYRRRSSLSQCGINIRGRRSRKLRINYRTTEETRRFATAILEGVEVDNLDEGVDSIKGYRSLLHGEVPEVRCFDSQHEEAQWIAVLVKKVREEADGDERELCLVARTNRQIDNYEATLGREGVETRRIKRDQADNRELPGIRLATMHRVKGLEFKYLVIAGANKGQIPLRKAVESSEDPLEKERTEIQERALFHVAATRAIRKLWVTCYGEPSPFLS